MRLSHALMVPLFIACTEQKPVQTLSAGRARPPIGFVGQWAQTWPESLRGDTLTLRADSTASGRLPPAAVIATMEEMRHVPSRMTRRASAAPCSASGTRCRIAAWPSDTHQTA